MIKTFEAYSPEKLDRMVNDFEREQKGFATQTHVTYDPIKGCLVYTAVVFYFPPKPAQD